MQKSVTFLIIVVSIIAVVIICTSVSQSSYAQQNTTKPVSFAKIFSEDKSLQSCTIIDKINYGCRTTIDVLYEDQSTVAIKSGYIDSIWKAVADVKKYGYKIDGITSYAISGQTGSKTVNILVVMSK